MFLFFYPYAFHSFTDRELIYRLNRAGAIFFHSKAGSFPITTTSHHATARFLC